MSNTSPVAVEADKKRPYKAYVAGALSGAATFVTAWVADVPPFEAKEVASAAVSAVVVAAAGFGITFSVPNPLVRKS